MRHWSEATNTGDKKFFLITLSHESLANYYKTTFLLLHHHKYSLTELEMMMPWEREVYVSLLLDQMEKEKEERMKNG